MGAWVSYGLGSLNDNLPTFVVLVARSTNTEQVQAISARLWSAGKLKTFSVRVVKSVPSGKQAGQGPSYEIAHVATEEGTRSWGKGGTTAAINLDGQQTATFSIERLRDKERFRLTSQVPGR